MVVIICGGNMKMEIKEIKIGGFRNIKNCVIDIDKITGLLSINSYGKSNILRGIEFGIDFITSSNQVRDNMFGWKSGFPKNKNIDPKRFNFELYIVYTNNISEYDIKYGFSIDWRLSEKESGGINKEYLYIKDRQKSSKFSQYINRAYDISKYKGSENGRCDKKINIDYNELVLEKLTAYDELFYLEILKEIKHLEVYVDRHLDSADAFEFEPIVLKNNDDLKLVTVDNIPRTLYKLKEQYLDKYNYLMDIFKQLFPKIERVETRRFELAGPAQPPELPEEYKLVEHAYFLYCKEYNMSCEINFKQMSDGAKRVLLLLTNLVLADINNVILFCVEEPENSINPSLFKQYIEVINDLSENTKIIITSHSPYLVDYLPPENLYIGCSNDCDIAVFKKIKKRAIKSLYRDSKEMDMSYGEYVFDLVSTGEDIDKYVE